MTNRSAQGSQRSGHERDPFATEVLGYLPSLRAYAVALTGNRSRGDDLLQESLARAFGARRQFTMGTNLRAWLFKIVRNRFLTNIESGKREVEDPDEVMAANLSTAPDQEWRLHHSELLAALQKLKPTHRDVLVLLASGSEYDEIMEICGLPIGTVKSRIHRARRELLEILGDDAPTFSHGASPKARPTAL